MIDPAPRESSPTDITFLLERLEEVLSAGTGLPFTRRRLVDDGECLEILEQIRLSLPNEIRQARRVNTEREALLDEAESRAAQIIRAAEMDAQDRIQEHHVAKRAETRAQEIIAQAERRVALIRREADDYAYSVLVDLERRLDGLIGTVRAGLQDLDSRPPVDREPAEDRDF
jgi:vacuolar-type H+-ATPase subunit H